MISYSVVKPVRLTLVYYRLLAYSISDSCCLLSGMNRVSSHTHVLRRTPLRPVQTRQWVMTRGRQLSLSRVSPRCHQTLTAPRRGQRAAELAARSARPRWTVESRLCRRRRVDQVITIISAKAAVLASATCVALKATRGSDSACTRSTTRSRTCVKSSRTFVEVGDCQRSRLWRWPRTTSRL